MDLRKAILMVLGLSSFSWGQATPTATAPVPVYTSFELPSMDGSLQYGLRASEVIDKGYTGAGGLYSQTNLSGDLAYSSRSQVHPFSMIYSGGVLLANQSSTGTTAYQSLGLSQSYVTRSWIYGISDIVSYLPQSPTVGLSGIPGTGDTGLEPVQSGTQPSQDILSIQNDRVSNAVTGTVQRQLDAFTSVSGRATYGILDFLGNGGLDSTQILADVSVNRRIDGRSSASLGVTYGTFNYSSLGSGASFATRGITASYQRQLSRSLNASVSGGPEWISSSSALGIPSRLTYTAGASLGYRVRLYTAEVGYRRGITGGSGVQPGAITDSVNGVLQRPFGAAWSASANVGYSRTQALSEVVTPVNAPILGLSSSGNYNGVYAGAQITRRLTRSLSAFGSYTAIHQDYTQTQVSPTALRGLVQSFAFGISYYPRSLHLGQL